MEEEIIQPISKELLKSELTPERCLRTTNKSHNELYVIRATEAPHVMQEIGRLREIAFRTAGGGTGKSVDMKPRRSLVATAISLARTGRSTPKDSPIWP